LKSITTTLLHFRKQSMPLMYGDFTIIETGPEYFIFSRSYFKQTVFVVINTSKDEKTFSIKPGSRYNINTFNALMNHPITKKEKSMEIKLQANTFEILYN
jgi:glycosidase